MFDAHAHFLPADYRTFLDERGISEIIGIPVPPWSPEAHIEFNTRFGIETAVLSLSDPGVFLPSLYDTRAAAISGARDWARETNDAAAEVIASHPGRFAAVASLPLPDVDAALAELARALDELELDGVILLSHYEGRYLGDPLFDPVMRELDRRAATVLIHPTVPIRAPRQPYPIVILEFPFETTRTVTSLLRHEVLSRYPGIRFQLPHCGGTLLREMLRPSDAESLARMWFDTAQAPTVEQLVPTRDFVGVARMVAGTDWPWAGYQFEGRSGQAQPVLREVFTETELEAVQSVNATRLYRSLAPAATARS